MLDRGGMIRFGIHATHELHPIDPPRALAYASQSEFLRTASDSI